MTAVLRWRRVGRHSRALELDCPHGKTTVRAIEPAGQVTSDAEMIRLAVARHEIECGCAAGIDMLMTAKAARA